MWLTTSPQRDSRSCPSGIRVLNRFSTRRSAAAFGAAILDLALATAIVLAPRVAWSSCDLIPSAQSSFRSTLGTTNRPFASPGDWVRIALDPLCHAASPGLPTSANDTVVSLVFGGANAVGATVLALAPSCAALEAARVACETQPGVARAVCREVQPDADVVVAPGQLFFRFPDTDDLVLAANDDVTLSGPVRIAVTATDAALPCAIAGTSGCTGAAGLRACVDRFLAEDGVTCGSVPNATFPTFTALPPPNDYQAVCESPVPPCTGLSDEVQIAADADGNLLLPMSWTGVLVDSSDVPVARRLRGTTPIEAFAGTGVPLRLPGQSFVGSFTTSGQRLAAFFDPTSAPDAGLTLSGATDAPRTVLRVARRSPTYRQCSGGPNDGLACVVAADCSPGECTIATCAGGANGGATCTSDADCPGSACGAPLFEFRDRLAANGEGPLVLRLASCLGGSNAFAPCTGNGECPGGQCADFEMIAADPVPLDGLVQGDDMNAFVTPEAILGADLNGDGDAIDEVVSITDRATGNVLPIGAGGVGRAVVRIREAPFSYPAIALEGSVVAFVEPETSQGDADQNGDGDIADTLLRTYRLDGTEIVPSPSNVQRRLPLAIDAAPLIGGRSVSISSGKVFFRSRESDVARQRTQLASATSAGLSGSSGIGNGSTRISADGRFVVFRTLSRLVPADTDSISDVYVRDMQTGVTELASVSSSGVKANAGPGAQLAISDDGRFVAFSSTASNLVSGDTNGFADVFVRDRQLGTTERVSVSTAGAQGTGPSVGPFLSNDGSTVAFTSSASNLIPDDFNSQTDAFIRDRVGGTTERIFAANGVGPPISARALSGDGRFTVVGNHPSFTLVDRALGTSAGLALDASGGQGDNANSFFHSLSDDGSRISISSDSTNFVAGDTNGLRDGFVYDVPSGRTTRVHVSTAGIQGGGTNLDASSAYLSADGRVATYSSNASNLVAGDTNGIEDAFAHDLLTGITTRVSVFDDGSEGTALAIQVTPSRGGRWIAFEATAALAPEDTNTLLDAYVRGPDRTDTAASDLFADGVLDDTVLEVVDASTGALTTLCPAEDVAVAAGRAAFLRPESASGTPACPAGSLNGDADVADLVVHLWNGAGSAPSLGRAATEVALSDTLVAVLVPEDGQDQGPLNDDGDTTDTVLQVYDIATGSWNDVNLPADVVHVSGDLVAFVSPESEEGADLDGDGDLDDRVIRLLVGGPTNPRLVEPGLATEDFVIGGHPGSEIVAFRVSETAQDTDLNGDTDLLDDVLHVYDVATDQVLNIGQAVTPCRLEACDPRVPYKVGRDTVTFLTFEPNQGVDLNGDGDGAAPDDLVLQVFNVRVAAAASFSALAAARSVFASGDSASAASLLPIASIKSGICSSSGTACGSDRECPSGTCLLPPGGCTISTGIPCGPSTSPCGAGTFCDSAAGVCKSVTGVCASNQDCDGGATCSPLGQRFQRIPAPFTGTRANDDVLSVGGRCMETVGTPCTSNADCAAAETCGAAGTCEREHGVCTTVADCPPGSACRPDLVVAGATDGDGDEIPDAFDNCPAVPNILQGDRDGDRVGDACDAATCGNGIVEAGEDCDHDATPGAGCDAGCRAVPLCTGGATISGPRLVLRGLGTGSGRQSFTLTGKLELAAGQPAGWVPLDLTTRGAQLRIEDLGANAQLVYDASQTTAPIPGGPVAPVCDARKRDGWTSNAPLTRYQYKNSSGRLPGAACAAGSSNGLRALRFDDTRGAGGGVAVNARARGATLPPVVGPLRVTVVLGADGAAGDAGACGVHTFVTTSCKRSPSGSTLSCR